jgi:hypothetical protein
MKHLLFGVFGILFIGYVVADVFDRVNHTGNYYVPQAAPTVAAAPAPVPAPTLPPASTCTPPTTKTDNDRLFERMVNNGIIYKTDFYPEVTPRGTKGLGKVYVDGAEWAAYPIDGKENLVKFMSMYRDEKVCLPQVTIYDSHSGRELASYGVFGGVSIKP